MSSLEIGYFSENGYIYEIHNLDDTIISQVKKSENHLYKTYHTKKFIIKEIDTITGDVLPFKPKYNLNETYNVRKDFYRIKELAINNTLLTKYSKLSLSRSFPEDIFKEILCININTFKLFRQLYSNNCKTYYYNGVLECEIYIVNNKRQGIYKSYYNNGNKYIETYFINDKVNGNLKIYDFNGQILYLQTYIDDQLHGEEITYHNNLIIKKCTYENNIKVGLEYEYTTNYKIKSIVPYDNGKIHGEKIIYWPNEKIRYLINYKNGKREGEHIEYDENENVKVITKYSNNKKVSA